MNRSPASERTSVTAPSEPYARTRRTRSQPSVASISEFPAIELTGQEQVECDRAVGRLLFRAVREYATYRSNGACVDRAAWSPVRSGANMTIYRYREAHERTSLLLGVGKIDGSLEDVMDGLYSDTSEDLATALTFLQSNVLAARVLQTSATRTPDDPFAYAGIKWFATMAPGGGFVSRTRDVLYYERQGTTFDVDGHEVAYHIMQSIDRPEVPASAFSRVVRAHTAVCCLYKRIGRSRVETFFLGDVAANGHLPQSLADYHTAGKWLAVAHAVKGSEARKLRQLRASARSVRSSRASITLSDITRCHLCTKRRSVFNTQRLCGGCYENVCRSCSDEKELFALDRAGRPLRDRFCNKCLVDVASQRGSRIPEPPLRSQPYQDTNSSRSAPAPAFFMYAFHLCGVRPRAQTVASSGRGAARPLAAPSLSPKPKETLIDTSYVDELLRRAPPPPPPLHTALESDDGERGDDDDDDDADWASLERRRQSHFETLLSTSPGTREKLLHELFTAPVA